MVHARVFYVLKIDIILYFFNIQSSDWIIRKINKIYTMRRVIIFSR